MSTDSLSATLAVDRARVDAFLARAFEQRQPPAPRLEAAMRHALLVGGKRLRPLLVYLAGRSLGASDEALDAPAAAVELIHAYSLVHDDLPAMIARAPVTVKSFLNMFVSPS